MKRLVLGSLLSCMVVGQVSAVTFFSGLSSACWGAIVGTAGAFVGGWFGSREGKGESICCLTAPLGACIGAGLVSSLLLVTGNKGEAAVAMMPLLPILPISFAIGVWSDIPWR